MERFVIEELDRWYHRKDRLPLILKGSRQVGKTFAVRAFLAKHNLPYYELNFEEHPEAKVIFQGTLNPETIVKELSVYARKLLGESDLLFFDEVQDCPQCLTALKYFAEKQPQRPVIAAGSLLGLTLAESSFPVGKVQYQWLGPLTFEEFLLGTGDTIGSELLRDARRTRSITAIGHAHLWQQLRRFYYCGGLPKAVMSLARLPESASLSEMRSSREVLQALIRDYQSDFSKHCGAANAMHIRMIFDNVPLQLAAHEDRTTDKYKFSHAQLGKTTGYSRLQVPIEWLERAGLLYRVRIANQAKHPLELYCKQSLFKLYTFDVGLVGAQLNLPPERIFSEDYGQSKGYFAETLALQGLVKDELSAPYSWQEASAEIEFLIVHGGEIIPVEVKAGHHTKAKSLDSYIRRYKPPAAIKLHAGNFGYSPDKKLHTMPLYMAWDLTGMDLY